MKTAVIIITPANKAAAELSLIKPIVKILLTIVILFFTYNINPKLNPPEGRNFDFIELL